MPRVSGTLLTSLFIATVVIFSFFANLQDFRSIASVSVEYGQLLSLKSPTADAESRPKNLYFVGDVMLARDVERTLLVQGSNYPYQEISFESDKDYVVANFEAAIPTTHSKTPDFTFRFSVDKRLLPPLRAAGFSHFSLANNHAFDFGKDAYQNTKNTLIENSFVPFGHPTILSTSSVVFVQQGDTRMALIGLHVLFTTPTDEVLQAVLSHTTENSDLQILYVHWGNEYAPMHSVAQEQLAKKIAKLGVDIIVGHHPHVVQDVALIGNTLVFYSLGNFIFDQYFSPAVQQGLVLQLDESLQINLLPVSSEANRAQPRYMEGKMREEFLNNLAQNSTPALSEQIKNGVIFYAPLLATSSEVAIMAP